MFMYCLCLQGNEIGQQAFCLMSPTQRSLELGESSKTGNLFTMFLTAPLMGFCLTSGNTDPSIQQLVDLQVSLESHAEFLLVISALLVHRGTE